MSETPSPQPSSTGCKPDLEVLDLGRMAYDKALELQLRMHEERLLDLVPDRLVLVEHPPVITLGRGGGQTDLLVGQSELDRRGVALHQVDRGGKATFHGPGQLVAYPILKLRNKDLHAYMENMLTAVATVLEAYGLKPELGLRGPGVWVGGAKIASIGMAVRKWVTYHGIALNVNTDLDWFSLINPCGYSEERMTSMARQCGRELHADAVAALFVEAFCRQFAFTPPKTIRQGSPTRPAWLRAPAPSPLTTNAMTDLLGHLRLDTVCQEAHCPNLGECFHRGTSTFMILGAVCTRGCRYCAVTKGIPAAPDPDEPRHVAEAVTALGLRHAVITSVTRDDLPDGGAGHFVATIEAIRLARPKVSIEVLVPDFAGDGQALLRVCETGPEVFNHNIETVPRLFPAVRPKADYARSIHILKQAAKHGLDAKSGIMLGLGETDDEILATMNDLRKAGCRYLTLGQYLAPSSAHVPVNRYIRPSDFTAWGKKAREMGFAGVASGPLVRSSYRAEDMLTVPVAPKGM